MWDLKILGIDFYHIAAWLLLYSFLGWAWETTYVSIKQRKLVNRGFVTGPLCTIYGIGAVGVYLILRPLEHSWLGLYFGGVVLATALEYITAVLMETVFHTGWWDYSHKKFNFEGRICLGSSAAWGVFTIIMFKLLQPGVEFLVDLVPVSSGKVIVIAATVLYLIDFSYATVTALQLGKRLGQIEHTMEELSQFLQESKVYHSALEFVDRLEPYRKGLNRSNLKEKMEHYQEAMSKRIEKIGIREQKDVVLDKVKVLADKFNNAIGKGTWNSRRLIRAYPHLSMASRLRRKGLKERRRKNKKK